MCEFAVAAVDAAPALLGTPTDRSSNAPNERTLNPTRRVEPDCYAGRVTVIVYALVVFPSSDVIVTVMLFEPTDRLTW